jgi:hypothetical protein
MPPHHHHRRGGFRGRRFGGPVYVDSGPDVIEETVFVIPSDLDAIFVPPTDDPVFKTPEAGMNMFEYFPDRAWRQGHRWSSFDAGDILPTVVTPDDAKRYLIEVDGGYSQLDAAIQAFAAAPSDYKIAWTIQIGSWKAFFASAMASVGWLNTTAVMQQTDRFNTQLAEWRKSFQAIGGSPPGPGPTPSGQGIPGPSPASDITQVALAVGAVAALVIFGPTIARSFSH